MAASDELRWYWLVYPAIVGLPSAHAVLVSICSGFSSPRTERVISERVQDALGRAEPIRAALDRLRPRQRRVLRLAYDCSWRLEREELERVATGCRLPGDLVTRRAHAGELLDGALVAYTREVG